jgi:hypothetical protein
MRCRVLKKLPRTQWQYGRDDDSRRQLGKLTKEARKQMKIRAGHHRLGKIVICLRKWHSRRSGFVFQDPHRIIQLATNTAREAERQPVRATRPETRR